MPDSDTERADDDEVEIEKLIVELPEGDDPALGQEIARRLVSDLRRLLAEM